MEKFCLIAMCKLENNYLDEWINYHLNIGFDKIVIIDNNDTYGEHRENIHDVSSINTPNVEIYPLNNGKYLQQIYYTRIYEKYKYEYDWFMCLDIDEFLTLSNHSTVQEFVKQEKFKNYNAIRLSWLIYGDSGIIESTNNFSVHRFTNPNYEHVDNRLVKTLFKTFKNEDLFFPNSHGPMAMNMRCCNGDGVEVKFPQHSYIPSCAITHKDAYIRHYITKTVSEYLNKKLIRGGSAQTKSDLNDKYNLRNFFKYNEATHEKINYIKKFFEGHADYDNVCEQLENIKMKIDYKFLFIGPCFMYEPLKYLPTLFLLNQNRKHINIDFIYFSGRPLHYIINNFDNTEEPLYYKYDYFNCVLKKNDNVFSINNLLEANKYDYIIYCDADMYHFLDDINYIDIHKNFIDKITNSQPQAKLVYYQQPCRMKYCSRFYENMSNFVDMVKPNKFIGESENDIFVFLNNEANFLRGIGLDVIEPNKIQKYMSNILNDVLYMTKDGSHTKPGVYKFIYSCLLYHELFEKINDIPIQHYLGYATTIDKVNIDMRKRNKEQYIITEHILKCIKKYFDDDTK